MTDNRANLEVIAPTIEEALAKGLSELGLTEDEVIVDILDQGSRGLFGLGSRQARVRLTIKALAPDASDNDEDEDQAFTRAPAPEIEPDEALDEQSQSEYAGELDLDDMLRVSREVVEDLLDKMRVRALVTVRFVEPEDERSKAQVWVDIRGNDLSVLIGPRAETLNAFQYIASLIVSKELNRSVPLVVDVEGYKSRRVQQLRQLARRMADQAVKTGRRQSLEPMPANERRIIHIELRNNPDVSTESIGEEPRRKVTIIPK